MTLTIGHEGSVYAATAGTRFPGALLEQMVVPEARLELDRPIKQQRDDAGVALATIDAQHEHLVALALHKAAVIEYQALLGLDRQRAQSDCVPLCGRLAEALASRITTALRRLR